mmetsp:Transcript_29622/g.64426  ORF Transcript_29622/g.64426 Transcript_29622/m.64426 type:complete len:212 (-) Transcript_29622:134-769(-)
MRCPRDEPASNDDLLTPAAVAGEAALGAALASPPSAARPCSTGVDAAMAIAAGARRAAECWRPGPAVRRNEVPSSGECSRSIATAPLAVWGLAISIWSGEAIRSRCEEHMPLLCGPANGPLPQRKAGAPAPASPFAACGAEAAAPGPCRGPAGAPGAPVNAPLEALPGVVANCPVDPPDVERPMSCCERSFGLKARLGAPIPLTAPEGNDL